MEYVYAALMLHKLQKDVNEENITSVVRASGADVNEAQVKSLVAALGDVNIDDAIQAVPAAAPAATAKEEPAKEETVKEEPKDESKAEESAMEGLASLFG